MIVLDQVSKTYDTGRFAVSEVSLRIPAGQMLVLLGEDEFEVDGA